MPAALPRALALAATLLAGCTTTPVVTLGTCDVGLFAPSAEEVRPGEPLTLGGTPLTTDWDTLVYVGGIEAEITSLERVGCETCDTCRTESLCTACGDCDVCDRLCAEQCDETLTVLVPELEPGPADVWIINRHGRSETLVVTVLAADEDAPPEGIETR
jgi:hypothetical protein